MQDISLCLFANSRPCLVCVSMQGLRLGIFIHQHRITIKRPFKNSLSFEIAASVDIIFIEGRRELDNSFLSKLT